MASVRTSILGEGRTGCRLSGNPQKQAHEEKGNEESKRSNHSGDAPVIRNDRHQEQEGTKIQQHNMSLKALGTQQGGTL